MKYLAPASLTAVALFAFSFAGCGSPAATPSSSPSATPAAADGEHGDHDHDDAGHDHGEAGHDHGEAGHDHGEAGHDHGDSTGMSAMEKMKTELAKLSPEDAASAEKQHMCPVTGEMLGTMGAPQKIDVNGQQVWVCCPGCKDTLLESPEKYLAKLNK